MYFLRKAQSLWSAVPQKELSPSFWDSEGVDPAKAQRFDAITAGVEYPLGTIRVPSSSCCDFEDPVAPFSSSLVYYWGH